jgi:hypothetical protein
MYPVLLVAGDRRKQIIIPAKNLEQAIEKARFKAREHGASGYEVYDLGRNPSSAKPLFIGQCDADK